MFELAEILWWGAAMLAAGVLAGFAAGLLGVGGGIVVVPVLFQVLSVVDIDPAARMHVAVATSLAIIIPTSLRSARSHHSRGAVDSELLKSWAPWIVFGVLIGASIAGFVNSNILTAVFAVIAVLVAIYLLFKKDESEPLIAGGLPIGGPKAAIAAAIGGFSTMMGIGGGTLSVPVLTAFGYPIRLAVGTAAAIGVLIAVPGTIGFVISGLRAEGLPPISIGYVNLVGFALIFPTTVAMAPVGAKVAHSISQRLLRVIFATFLGVTSASMFFESFMQSRLLKQEIPCVCNNEHRLWGEPPWGRF